VTCGLRHLAASAEPALVFTHVAAICVPTVCDRCVIDICEGPAASYRIRRPGGAWSIDESDGAPDGAAAADPAIDHPTATPDGSTSYRLTFSGSRGSPLDGAFTGVLTGIWHDVTGPSTVDRRLLHLIVDYACAVVQGAGLRAVGRPVPGTPDPASSLVAVTRQQMADAVAAITAIHHRTAARSSGNPYRSAYFDLASRS
jgi:hypothetical protein